MWKRVIAFLAILFFVLLSDAVLSDWVPGYLQGVLGSPLAMGLMMALSSVVGFVMDLLFPQLLRSSGVRKLGGGALLGALAFMLSMLSSTLWSYILLLAVGMSAWGIYYELDSFMTQQFVAGVAPSHERSSVWGIVRVVRHAAYFFGPIVGGYVAIYGDRAVVLGSMAAVSIPTNPEYGSLNLGAAVQIMTYLLREASGEQAVHESGATRYASPVATVDAVEGFYGHLESAMIAAGFHDPQRPRRLMPKVRRIFERARLEADEVNILRGIVSALASPTKPNKVD